VCILHTACKYEANELVLFYKLQYSTIFSDFANQVGLEELVEIDSQSEETGKDH